MRDHRNLNILRLLFLCGFFLEASPTPGRAEESGRTFPLPLIEAQRVLTAWLNESGFRVHESRSGEDQILLEASRGSESWRILLRPRSPLASSVLAECTRNGQPDPSRVEPLLLFLEAYSRGLVPQREKPGREVPPPVQSLSAAAVLIKGLAGKQVLQFSGFVVDPGGWVLSTAHDLAGVRGLKVILGSGRELEARLIRRDLRRDLSLLGVEGPLPSFIDLAAGRNLLEEREPVFAVCYAETGEKIGRASCRERV